MRERFVAAWDRFWHTPADPRVAAGLRIGVGVIVFLAFLFQAPYATTWWGEDGLLPSRVARRLLDPDAGSVLLLLPPDDLWLWACFGLAMVQALLLAVGWHSHVQAACLFVWLVSFQHRNQLVIDGEDAVMRLITFFLIFAPISERWSLDALRGRTPRIRSGWALRMIQIQVTFVFLAAGLEKLPGSMWRDGTALYHIFLLDDFYPRFALPEVIAGNLWVSRLMSWGTLALEVAVPIGVWIPRTRALAVAAAIFFHLALDLLMNLYFFEWIMIVGWLSFVRWDEDLPWLGRWAAPAASPAAAD